jgi:SAM-dependent methyltransferase
VKSAEEAARAWAAEYGSKGLPSSFREEPSGAVRDFVPMALGLGVCAQEAVAIDIGCGTGRNSLYLAQQGFIVHALDMVPEMISQLREKADAAGSRSRLRAVCANVCEPWPIEGHSAAIAIDTFCYKHVMEAEGRLAYRRELARTLKPGGLFLLTLASIEDAYYGLLPFRQLDDGMRAINDPGNGIDSVLYERFAIEQSFADEFDVLRYAVKRKPGLMHGAEYLRVTHVFIARRR